ncbi:hypothetical protein HRG_012990 [Hirsutella rhossiliensis]
MMTHEPSIRGIPKAMGLPLRYSKTEYDWCLDWKQMSRSCGSRKWTKEEMMAYLDWDKAEEERLDARVAEEMQAQPFSRERGTAGIWADCERDSEEQQANYSRI